MTTTAGNVHPNEVSTIGPDGNTGPMREAWTPTAKQPQDHLPKKKRPIPARDKRP